MISIALTLNIQLVIILCATIQLKVSKNFMLLSQSVKSDHLAK